MQRIRLVQRRSMLYSAWLVSERAVAAAILPVYHRQQKRLERHLRRANLRKRMDKIGAPPAVDRATDAIKDRVDVALYKAQTLTGDLGTNDWLDWKKALAAAIILALISQVPDLSDIENEVWISRGYGPLTFIAADVVAAIETRTGINFGDAADTVMRGVEADLAEWYLSDEPFSSLMARLDKWFGDARANSVATTQTGNLISQIVFQAMLSHGWSEWFWDALGPNPCSRAIVIKGTAYGGCIELHGHIFKIGDPMPPDAAHPFCHCLPTPKE